PALPDVPAPGGEDFQLAALGVEDDVAVADDRRGGAVVAGLVLPGELAGDGVEGVEVVAAEAAAEEHQAVGDGGGGQRAAAGGGDLPPADGALARPGRGRPL